MMPRAKRHIISGIVCGLIVRIGINAKHAEVACMPRPNPIVGIASKLTNRRRRCTDQANVIVRDCGD